jgi:four helix bundle protein
MGTIKRFEEIEAWLVARQLVMLIYQVSSQGDWSRDFGLRDQIGRAAISTMSNIAEGFERSSSKEFARFLTIAKASSGEVRSQLYVAIDLGYLEPNEGNELIKRTECVSKRIAAFIKYLE